MKDAKQVAVQALEQIKTVPLWEAIEADRAALVDEIAEWVRTEEPHTGDCQPSVNHTFWAEHIAQAIRERFGGDSDKAGEKG